MKSVIILLLLSTASSLRLSYGVKDMDEEENTIKPDATYATMLTEQTNMFEADKALIHEYSNKLTQSHRNVQQGTLGRSLA